MVVANPDLLTLRDALSRCDMQILESLSERMRLIREAAAIKARSGLALFDREREGAHMGDLHARAAEAGLSAEIVRDVFGTLFAASRGAQREKMMAQRERFSIGIIGGTAGMGAFLARLFSGAGHAVETTGLTQDGQRVGAPKAEI